MACYRERRHVPEGGRLPDAIAITEIAFLNGEFRPGRDAGRAEKSPRAHRSAELAATAGREVSQAAKRAPWAALGGGPASNGKNAGQASLPQPRPPWPRVRDGLAVLAPLVEARL